MFLSFCTCISFVVDFYVNVQPTSYNHNLCAEFGFEEMGCRGASAMRKLCAIYAHSHATTTTGRPAARRRQTRNWTRPGPASTDNRQAPGDTGTLAPAKPTQQQQQQQQQKQTGKAEAETHPPKKTKVCSSGSRRLLCGEEGTWSYFLQGRPRFVPRGEARIVARRATEGSSTLKTFPYDLHTYL